MPLSNGHEWEKDVFGVYSHFTHIPEYLPKNKAFAQVKELQSVMGLDVYRPRTIIGRYLFHCVQTRIVECDPSTLQLYCALGTALDFHHGVDGFFTCTSDIETVRVTFDLKSYMHPRTKEAEKADVILYNPIQLKESIELGAEKIAKLINHRARSTLYNKIRDWKEKQPPKLASLADVFPHNAVLRFDGTKKK